MEYNRTMTDEELVKGCIENRSIAPKKLYDRFSRKMFGVCLRYTDDRDEAQDVLQNGFIKVFENIETFKATGSLEGWIRRIMVNTALNHYRQEKASRLKVDLESVDYMLEGSDGVEGSLDAKELLKIIQ